VCDFDPGQDLGTTICWTLDQWMLWFVICDLNLDEGGNTLLEYGGPSLVNDISSLPGITQSP
jgi:hypothetical protein